MAVGVVVGVDIGVGEGVGEGFPEIIKRFLLGVPLTSSAKLYPSPGDQLNQLICSQPSKRTPHKNQPQGI